MNLFGLVAVFLLLVQLSTHWQIFAKWRRVLLSITWLILAITLWQLFQTHNAIDALLEIETRSVGAGFDPLHDFYELVATVQWITAVIHLAVMLTYSDKPPTTVAVAPPDQS
ncbi:MAG: hypothetical protein ACPGVU_03890 [Limisphaerales bacterium]